MGAIVRPAAVLLAICLVISASLAFTYAATKGRIDASEAEEANGARAEALPGADFEPVYVMGADEAANIDGFPAVTEIFSAHSPGPDGARQAAGHVATVVTYGYGGEVYVIVGVSNDGRITGVRVSRHSETPGLGANTAKPEYYEQFTGKDASLGFSVAKSGAGASEKEIVAVSGATISSDAVAKAVNEAARAIAEYSQRE